MKATKIKDLGSRNFARQWLWSTDTGGYIVSAETVTFNGPATMLFHAGASGELLNDAPFHTIDVLSHVGAIAGAGYEW